MDSWNTSFLLGWPIFSGFFYWFHDSFMECTSGKKTWKEILKWQDCKGFNISKRQTFALKTIWLRMVLLRVLINHASVESKLNTQKPNVEPEHVALDKEMSFWKPSFSASSGSSRAFKRKTHATSWFGAFPCISLQWLFLFQSNDVPVFSLPPQKKNTQKHTTLFGS